jgi:hypothetical protein
MADYLYEKRADIWVDTNTKIHKYVTQYANANPVAVRRYEDGIGVTLTHSLRADLYDYPLTLLTEVPFNWENCLVAQDGAKTTRPVRNGRVMYEAVPNKGEVRLTNY